MPSPNASFLVLFLAGTTLTSSSEAREPTPFTVGVGTHFNQAKGASPELNLERVQAAGIRSIRDELSWSSIETARGQLAIPAGRDHYLRRATAIGLQPLLILDYGNRFHDGGGHPRSDEAVEGFCRYAEFLVRQLGKDVRLYEIWNEWDIGIGLRQRARGEAADYFRLLKAVYPRIKAVDAGVTVFGAGGPTTGGIDRGWLEELVKLGALEYCDVLSIHSYNYSAPGPRGGPEAWHRWVRGVQSMLRKYSDGQDVPLQVTEMGWPSHVGPRGRDPETCASYLARLYLLARTLPFVRGVWWYDFQDDGWKPEYNEHNFGLVRPDLTPKPAYHVLADLADVVTTADYLGRVETADEHVWILRFRHESREIWATWCGDDRPRQIVIEQAAGSDVGKLSVREVGRRPLEVSWGHRAWADTRNAALAKNQFSFVIAARPWILGGNVEGARVRSVTPRFADETGEE